MEKQLFDLNPRPSLLQRVARLTVAALVFIVLVSKLNWLEEAENTKDPKEVVLQSLETNHARNWSRIYTAEKHLAGTNYGLVEFTRSKFAEYGAKATVDDYHVLLSYPEDHSLSLMDKHGNVEFKASLREDEVKEDPTSVGNDTVPTFLGYAANGNVTAQYVYVNYGTIDDFLWMEENGVSVKGKIVIARYGRINRGIKVKFAQDFGAEGILIYSDPADDGDITTANGYKSYPHGPARQESSVQRGSVMFLGALDATPGDPTTPGYASKKGAKREDPHNSICKIPALPVSYKEVKPLLAKLNGHGKNVPESWKGTLEGVDYSTGPHPSATLNLYNKQEYKITPIWNVYGEFEGKNKDEAIVIGNHRDAWIKGGAGDPNSGSSVLIEIARALGDLKQSGFEFERTIILKSWDGEEYGLIGSTEFGEYAAKRLQKNVVAYINTDVAVQGSLLSLGASPVLNKVLRKVAKWLPYPGKDDISLYDHFVKEKGDIIRNLGSGSDYTVFLEHLGIPSADISFKSGKKDPIYHYHSNYDSFHWMDEFGDPGFVFHNLAAKYLALLALELSQHKVIEFSLHDYAKDLLFYFELAKDTIPKDWLDRKVSPHLMAEYIARDHKNDAAIDRASQNLYAENTDVVFPEFLLPFQCRHMRRMMKEHEHHKTVTLGEIVNHTQQQLEQLKEKTSSFDYASAKLQRRYNDRRDLHWWQRVKLHFRIKHQNKLIQYFERNFLHEEGLHRRPWFKHIVFAVGRYAGYAGQTWPGIREAVEDEDFNGTVKWLGIAARAARRVSLGLHVA
ncbi:hypothetical_protein [Candidozyma auris]|uniref:hypothetical_protein n=1 Tax=Candidozyma auris TaxID=498019 RepID=UPI000D2C3F5B|nr:hypothetical_protein [[Candida] auris]QEO19232.1 hypothetical_protein [[Candida] auris]GBL50788.1 hypothetical protein CAJCM15448_30620 [[Candida] auris]